jgi:hypothetical protein
VDRNRWLLLINFAIAFYNVGTVWLVHVTCYPLWAVVGRGEFEAYHEAWWHSIWGVILGPALFGLLGAWAMLWWPPARVPARGVWLGIVLEVAVYLLTAVWWGPLMARLVEAVDPSGTPTPLYRLLLSTHWLRVALITAYGLLMFWLVRVSFGLGDREPITSSESGSPAGMPAPAGLWLIRGRRPAQREAAGGLSPGPYPGGSRRCGEEMELVIRPAAIEEANWS